MILRSVVLLALVAVAATPGALQARNYGDGFAVGGILVPGGAQAILGATRLGDSLGLEVDLGVNVQSDDDTSQTGLFFGIGMKRYWNTDSQLQPFIGGRFAIRHTSYDFGEVESDDTLFGLRGIFGAEYFVTKRLSLDGEGSIGISFGSFELNTGTRLAAFLYL